MGGGTKWEYSTLCQTPIGCTNLSHPSLLSLRLTASDQPRSPSLRPAPPPSLQAELMTHSTPAPASIILRLQKFLHCFFLPLPHPIHFCAGGRRVLCRRCWAEV